MQGHLVLIGMMGAGKTAVGAELARRLQVPFFDSDAEIERAAAMSIPEIFARDGEEFFRDREAQVLARLLAGPAGVISTGGGAWLRPVNRDTIRQSGLAVWLDCDIETLWHRVKLRPTRPLLMTEDPKGTLIRLLDERRPAYAQADVTVNTARSGGIAEAANRVIAHVTEARPDFLTDSIQRTP